MNKFCVNKNINSRLHLITDSVESHSLKMSIFEPFVTIINYNCPMLGYLHQRTFLHLQNYYIHEFCDTIFLQ